MGKFKELCAVLCCAVLFELVFCVFISSHSLFLFSSYDLSSAELMFGLGQTKKKKESEAKVRTTKANLKDVNITETIESNVRGVQHNREKSEKATARTTRTNLRDVNITETLEGSIRGSQHNREKTEKASIRTTKDNLKDVNITDTIESDVRKEHNTREKDWKETGKQQKKSNTNFDMARK